ncbi:cell envelope biogenesis protein TolA [Dickeya lacustris]|uniref:Cell envelope biogenesis protein TolA n=1 Tax=Dickeya lacustris TaxID=2259638 RepID=A0ABY8G2S5_9GAMM|nr:cell envelope biogenesis protein TolA [Dickeya lacustris]WFN54235.1 cell envelope biogenesis protein TolA [Dickeya lacustris]
MTSPISTSRYSTMTALTQSAKTENDARLAQTHTDTNSAGTSPSLNSVMVQFSDEVRKRFDAAMRENMSQLGDVKKDVARSRVEQIKQRIQMLKMMLMSLAGQAIPPGLLSELRQLARELGQAAQALNQGGGGAAVGNSSGEAPASDAAQSGAGAASAAAESASAGSEAVSAGEGASTTGEAAKGDSSQALAQAAQALQNQVAAFMAHGNGSSERQADAKAVQEAVRELKSLLAMVKHASKQSDKETQKKIQEIDNAVADTEKTVQSMNVGGGSSDISVEITTGTVGNVSVDVQV